MNTTYMPNSRDAKGMQTFIRPAMAVTCDVCGIPRTRGNHQRRAKIRQAVGFINNADTSVGHVLDKAKGCKPDLNFQPAQAQQATEKSA
ncbi:hypothetical protein [Pseudomonas entomophila]|uniref:hypothetical protein n=1 Tax=Pseudomonas entomophila TaxID=312306 RepID=UPI001F02D273|nr:hypothetical protein [Pseudomonas entomophila]MCG8294286.1 hypothetical protein [Pseudomonas entomophila]